MRFKFLLIFVFAMSILRGQDTIRTLIISEARIDQQHNAYVELTNVGTTDINLKNFEFGKVGPWTNPVTAGTTAQWFQVGANDRFMLPDKVLAPGKSFVMAKVNDWTYKQWLKAPDLYNKLTYKKEHDYLADMKIHVGESPTAVPQSVDSISPMASAFTVWNGSYCWYLRYHYMLDATTKDSVVVDQVNGVFDDTDFTSLDVALDVAGVVKASVNSTLIRKSTIKKGNVNFKKGKGENAAESEWIVVPMQRDGYEPERALFWTVKNHGNYKLSDLTSSKATINWNAGTLTVPWGVRNNDSIMSVFNKVPGIGWHYDYAKNHEDSAFMSARTGDILTVYACGDTVGKFAFSIVALPPTASDNKVIPKYVPNNRGYYPGVGVFCEVSDGVPGMDTISLVPYACRVDTFMKYLEKPAIATWEFVWVDGIQRTDLKKGDILKVTSQNGAVKQYYIKTEKYFPSHDAYLSSITWPDIPEGLRGIYGWTGDTIPNFLNSKLNYRLMVPWDVDGIPALVAHKQQLNSKLTVKKAINLTGGVSDRSITFTNVAQDDTTIKVYNVELVKEKDQSKIQPWDGHPFFSQFIFKQDYNNDFLEIVNPRPGVVDLSDYMVTFGYTGSPATAITDNTGTGNWNVRYRKYIPGYKWVDEATWASTPAVAIPDASINPIVEGGDVFAMAFINSASTSGTYPAFVIPQIDIDFNHNPWGESLGNPWDGNLRQWVGAKYMLFKILNDTVKMGLKPANDPNDFLLVDVIGTVAGDNVFGGKAMGQVTQYVRKPQYFKGNTVIGGSNGTTEENSEWIMMDESRYAAAGYGWPATRIMVADGIGSHFMDDVTIYRSTVSSNSYKVSDGYTNNETIKGLGAGTTVTAFLANVVKADTGQHLKVRAKADGSILGATSVIAMGDTLIVVSQDSVNTSKYIIDVTPLSNNAVLTSIPYTVNTTGATGTIAGFAYGTKLKTVFDGVTPPAGASIVVADGTGAYQPFKILNYDTVYVDVTVNDKIQFIVTAEDGVTKIVYTLKPTVLSSDAFVTSDVYSVDQTNLLIELVPNGTAVSAFISNIVPVTGATVKIVDKLGMERTFGNVSKDDKLVVTAADGFTVKTYYFSVLGVTTKYLAFVLSNDYAIDQVTYKIKVNLATSTTVTAFLAKLMPAASATMAHYDNLGNVKAGTANIAEGDVVKVTSGDGSKVVNYTVTSATKAQTANDMRINVYPNPSADHVFVSGIEAGNRICVYNILGELVQEKVAIESTEELKFSNQKGIYFVKVSAKGKKDVTAKIILK